MQSNPPSATLKSTTFAFKKGTGHFLSVNTKEFSKPSKERVLTEEQTQKINQIVTISIGMVLNAVDIVNLSSENSTLNDLLSQKLYEKWFKDADKLIVRTKLLKLAEEMIESPIEFHNLRKKDVNKDFEKLFAMTNIGDEFVMPTESQDEDNDYEKKKTPSNTEKSSNVSVYLGPLFWTSELHGKNGQCGTIIHELTHAYLGAYDFAYGEKCTELSAKHAIVNADTFQYFCEEAWNIKEEFCHFKQVDFTGNWEKVLIQTYPSYEVSKDTVGIKLVGEKKYDMKGKMDTKKVIGIMGGLAVEFKEQDCFVKAKVIAKNIIQAIFPASDRSPVYLFMQRDLKRRLSHKHTK